jgi:FkbM family methyltransferase
LTPPVSKALQGVFRSLRIYHGDKLRAAAMDRLYKRFIAPRDLVFDIGAHVGDRISSFRRLGARVVALEPQPLAHRALRLIHGRDQDVVLLAAACSDQGGVLRMKINTANPTISTASSDFIAAAEGAGGWEGQTWDGEIEIECVTLDALIARFGVPAFAKIDVEGFEAHVLTGLSQCIRALSFEFTTIQRDVAQACLVRLAALGPYRFNVALGESQQLTFQEPVAADAMKAYIAELPHEANSGDVYAMV